MTKLRPLFLLLAIVGAVWPMWHYVTYLTSEGASFGGLFEQWTSAPAITGMAVDLVVAMVTLVIWCLAETIARRNWIGLLAIPAGVCIGVSCGLPLYLYLRARRT